MMPDHVIIKFGVPRLCESVLISEDGMMIVDRETGQNYKIHLHKSGSPATTIKQRLYYIRRLVASAFLPTPTVMRQVYNKDGNVFNNHYFNLAYSEPNNKHKSNRNPYFELPFEIRTKIYKAYKRGLSVEDIAKKYNIYSFGVRRIVEKYKILLKTMEEIKPMLNGMELRTPSLCDQFLVSEDGSVIIRKDTGLLCMVNTSLGVSYKQVNYRIPHLIASAFLPPPDSSFEKPCVMHIDGDASNNHYTNLAYFDIKSDTMYRKNKISGKYKNIKLTRDQTGMVKITSDKVKEIKQRRQEGISVATLAEEYSVALTTIYRALKSNKQ